MKMAEHAIIYRPGEVFCWLRTPTGLMVESHAETVPPFYIYAIYVKWQGSKLYEQITRYSEVRKTTQQIGREFRDYCEGNNLNVMQFYVQECGMT